MDELLALALDFGWLFVSGVNNGGFGGVFTLQVHLSGCFLIV